MDFEKFTFRQIEADTVIKPFDCGDTDLNGFLFEDAKQYLDAMLAVTYLLEDNEANKTVAYYCLLNDKIELDSDEKSKIRFNCLWLRAFRSLDARYSPA